jgi:hypothetical protein
MRLKVKSQIWDQEAIKRGILDDCGPASVAACIGWATGYVTEPGVDQTVHAYQKINGRVDEQGKLSAGTTFAGNIKVAKAFGVAGKWPKTWAEIIAAGKKGAAILLNVQAPKNYPPQAMSAWAKKQQKRKSGSTYGHYVAVAYCDDHGWQVADPTMTGKGKEALGALITEDEFKAMASSKGRALASTCIIFPQVKKPAPIVPPKAEKAEPVAPATIPVAAPAVVVSAPVVAPKPIVAAVRRILGRFGRIAK